jgi:chromate transporter
VIYLELFLEFLRVGLFSFGGGHATFPFLYEIAQIRHWFTPTQLADMIAVGSVIPGAVGVNVAAFAGFSVKGILGAAIAVAGLILPSIVLAVIISRVIVNFRQNIYVNAIIDVLKPVSCGMLATVGVQLFVSNVTNMFAVAFFVILSFMCFYRKRSPKFVMGLSAIAGLIAGILSLN